MPPLPGYRLATDPVTVHDGVVTLTGRPENDQAGQELVERVRHIEGVVAVVGRLSYAGKV
jgi:osmotically-inducible protein OsmY